MISDERIALIREQVTRASEVVAWHPAVIHRALLLAEVDRLRAESDDLLSGTQKMLWQLTEERDEARQMTVTLWSHGKLHGMEYTIERYREELAK